MDLVFIQTLTKSCVLHSNRKLNFLLHIIKTQTYVYDVSYKINGKRFTTIFHTPCHKYTSSEIYLISILLETEQ